MGNSITKKAVIGCLQQIFGSWIGSDFTLGKRTRTRVDGERKDANNFEVTPLQNIAPFTDNQKEAIEQYKKDQLENDKCMIYDTSDDIYDADIDIDDIYF